MDIGQISRMAFGVVLDLGRLLSSLSSFFIFILIFSSLSLLWSGERTQRILVRLPHPCIWLRLFLFILLEVLQCSILSFCSMISVELGIESSMFFFGVFFWRSNCEVFKWLRRAAAGAIFHWWRLKWWRCASFFLPWLSNGSIDGCCWSVMLRRWWSHCWEANYCCVCRWIYTKTFVALRNYQTVLLCVGWRWLYLVNLLFCSNSLPLRFGTSYQQFWSRLGSDDMWLWLPCAGIRSSILHGLLLDLHLDYNLIIRKHHVFSACCQEKGCSKTDT